MISPARSSAVSVSLVSSRPGSHRARRARRARCSRSCPPAAASRCAFSCRRCCVPGHAGGLAADRADAGPGATARGQRHRRHFPQFEPRARESQPRACAALRGRVQTAVCRARAPAHPGFSRRSAAALDAPRESPRSSSTRRIACRSGVTTFGPSTGSCDALRKRFPDVPMLAFTATATPARARRHRRQLRLHEPAIHIASFNRPNLYYAVRPKDKRTYDELLARAQARTAQASSIACRRKRVDELARAAAPDGVSALPYHAGLDAEQRRAIRSVHSRRRSVIVATIAFGMGINKPDVRWVIHYDLPKTLEGYYQESGRAGRDGDPARCILYFGAADIRTAEFLIQQKVDPDTGEPLEEEQRTAASSCDRCSTTPRPPSAGAESSCATLAKCSRTLAEPATTASSRASCKIARLKRSSSCRASHGSRSAASASAPRT